MIGLTIQTEDRHSPAAAELIAALDAELGGHYPEPGANHFRLDDHETAPGRGVFLVARLDGAASGCGAVRLISETEAEIKRMYVRPSRRGRGIARALLARLETEARRLGARRLLLETGERQQEAIGLYESAGYVRVPRFGEYVDSPLSICMARDL